METATEMTAAAVTAEIPAATETPVEAGGVTSGQAEATTPETTVPAVTAAPMGTAAAMAATTGIREAAEMTTATRTATAAGVKTAAARTTIQARTGGTGCSGREVGLIWRIART